jgi:hypothetical protein
MAILSVCSSEAVLRPAEIVWLTPGRVAHRCHITVLLERAAEVSNKSLCGLGSATK